MVQNVMLNLYIYIYKHMNNFCIFKNFIECIIYYFLLFNLSLNEMFKSQIISGDYSKKKQNKTKKKKKNTILGVICVFSLSTEIMPPRG